MLVPPHYHPQLEIIDGVIYFLLNQSLLVRLGQSLAVKYGVAHPAYHLRLVIGAIIGCHCVLSLPTTAFY